MTLPVAQLPIALDLNTTACRWLMLRVVVPCSSFRLCLTRLHGSRPRHKTLGGELPSRVWLQEVASVPLIRAGDPVRKALDHYVLGKPYRGFYSQQHSSQDYWDTHSSLWVRGKESYSKVYTWLSFATLLP